MPGDLAVKVKHVRHRVATMFAIAGNFLVLLFRPNRRVAAAYKLMLAGDGDFPQRSFVAFASGEAGHRLILNKPNGIALLRDRAELARTAPGTLGHAYQAFMEGDQLDEDFYLPMVDAHRSTMTDADQLWYRMRIEAGHDLRHVLAGYGTDQLGEACLITMRYAQTRNVGCLLIAGLSAVVLLANGPRGSFASMREAYRRGRAAALLDLVPWEEQLSTPLAGIRAAFGLTAPEIYLRTGGSNIPEAHGYGTLAIAA